MARRVVSFVCALSLLLAPSLAVGGEESRSVSDRALIGKQEGRPGTEGHRALDTILRPRR